MRFSSTRGQAPPVSFSEAALTGWAADGGMLLPEKTPQVSAATLHSWRGLSYPRLAARVLALFTEGELALEEWEALVERAFRRFGHPDVVALQPLAGEGVSVAELWHGPTLAFKDLGLQILGELLQLLLTRADDRTVLLVGTSGDTGSAAIEAFAGLDRVRIAVLYPHGGGRITRAQEQQMAVPAARHANVALVGVDGSSDDLDEPLTAVFLDEQFRDAQRLNSVNSVNVVRILVQTVHYFYAYLQQGLPPRMAFAVPTGAAGHITSGLLARDMGLPIDLCAATNDNDVLRELLDTGVLRRRASVQVTPAPSMDIQVPYNVERILALVSGRNAERVRAWMAALMEEGGELALDAPRLRRLRRLLHCGAASAADVRETIRAEHAASGYVLDPHTAVGVCVGRQWRRARGVPLVCMGCAHAAKFADTVAGALGLSRAEAWRLSGMALEHPNVAAVAALDDAPRVPPSAVWGADERGAWEEKLRELVERWPVQSRLSRL